jgi:nitroreductase
MMTRREINTALAGAAFAATIGSAGAQEAGMRALPPPRTAGGMPLMDALKVRRSTREYADRPLSPQILSNLLWAANGVSRASDLRTAPYWRHIMVIDIYAAMAGGVWFYDPIAHALAPHLKDDIRAATGTQDFVGVAALDLIYVAHGERMTDVSLEDKHLFASVDAGFIGQNVYLYCASEGLGSVFRGALDQAEVGKLLRLPDGQFVTFAQTVGYARAV